MKKRIKPEFVLPLFVFVNYCLLMSVRFFPYPEIFIYPYLKNLGFLPYREIIDQHFPGLFFLPINFATLGVRSVVGARVFQLFLVVLNHALIYYYFKSSVKKYEYKFLWANALYLVWSVVVDGHILWIDSILASLILSSTVLIEKSKKIDIYFAFFLMGLAVVFKQTAILFPIATLLLFRKRFGCADLIKFGLVSLLPIILSTLYIYSIGVLPEFVQWTLVFNTGGYKALATKIPTVYQAVVIAPIILLGIYSVIGNIAKRKEVFISSFFVISLVFVYPRFELVHLTLSVVLGILLIVKYYNYYKYFCFMMLGLFILGFVMFFKNYLFLSQEIPSLSEEVVDKVDELTEVSDTIYAYSVDPLIYIKTKTVPLKPYFIHLPWYLVELEDEILKSLRNDPPDLVVRDTSAVLDGVLISDHMQKINSFVEENYYLEFEEESIQIFTIYE